jgi:hypothetical protein
VEKEAKPTVCGTSEYAAECRERRLRREALQIAAQLPEELAEAVQVLDYAKELLGFMEPSSERPSLHVVK